MRPYYAILKDSFREAFSSRVLWILLIVTTVILVLIAPFGLRTEAATALSRNDLLDPEGFVARLGEQGDAEVSTPGKHIWGLLSEGIRERISKLRSKTGLEAEPSWLVTETARDELNSLLRNRSFYQPENWAGRTLSEEGQELAERGSDTLSDLETARLNRLALEAAFPEFIASNNRRDTFLEYAGHELLPMQTFEKEQAVGFAISLFMSYFVGVIGVIAALIVTSNIIPVTYEQGAVDLLLSKPVSRPLVYLTKYFGGCAFVLINGTYVVIGMWAIAGLRHDVWNHKLFLCVPLFMFLFAIYYCVSALAGLLWRNAIICVVMSVLLWLGCFLVGIAKNSVEFFAMSPSRLNKISSTNDGIFAANEAGEIVVWDADKRVWATIMGGSESGPVPRFVPRPNSLGPLYEQKTKRVLAILPQFSPGRMATGDSITVAERNGGAWRQIEGVRVPTGTNALFLDTGGDFRVTTPRGIMRLQGEVDIKPEEVKIAGVTVSTDDKGSKFVDVGPQLELGSSISSGRDAKSGAVAIFDGTTLVVLDPDSEKGYVERGRRVFEERTQALITVLEKAIVLVERTGFVRVLDPKSLETLSELPTEDGNVPRFVESSPDGKMAAIMFHNRRLWLYTSDNDELVQASVPGQGDVSAAAFTSQGTLLTVSDFTDLVETTLAQRPTSVTNSATPTFVEGLYRWAIRPIYTVFPKPGELDNVTTYILSGEETISMTGELNDLAAPRQKLNIWPPIWSNLAFCAVMLGLGCLYAWRRDF